MIRGKASARRFRNKKKIYRFREKSCDTSFFTRKLTVCIN